MTSAARLAEIITALEGANITCLVMGGHAVRYYGFNRNTIDFDAWHRCSIAGTVDRASG